MKGLKTHVSRMHTTSNGVIPEKEEEVEDSIPQIDGHSEQKSDVSKVVKDKLQSEIMASSNFSKKLNLVPGLDYNYKLKSCSGNFQA